VFGVAGISELGEIKEFLLIEGCHVLHKNRVLVW
jgi:hypothetical protein